MYIFVFLFSPREIHTLKTPKQSTPSISPITSPVKDPALDPAHRGERREPIGQETSDDTPPSASSSNQVEALRDIQPEPGQEEEEEEEEEGVAERVGEGVDEADVGVSEDLRSGEGEEEHRGEVEGQPEEETEVADGSVTRRK